MAPEIAHLNQLLTQRRGITLERALGMAIWLNNADAHLLGPVQEPHAVTLKWVESDTRANYRRHIKQAHTRAQLVEYGWFDTVIDYHINRGGFRSTHEYDSVTEPCIVTLGCSFTFGTGLHQHQIWPQLLADKLGVSLVNLGMPGHSLDLNSLWLHLLGHGILNPIAVVVYEPPLNRISWLRQSVIDDQNSMILSGNLAAMTRASVGNRGTNSELDTVNVNREQFVLSTSIMENLLLNSVFHSVKNYHLINSWCDSKNIPLIWNKDRPNFNYPEVGPGTFSLARDLAHYGPDWHEYLTDRIYAQIKERLK